MLFQFFFWNFSTFKRFNFSTFFLLFLAQQLVICVRLALKEGATGAWLNHFSGYIITLLVIFYMQVTDRLPPVVNLQSEPGLSTEKCGGMFLWFISSSSEFIFLKNKVSFWGVLFRGDLVCFYLRVLHRSLVILIHYLMSYAWKSAEQ